MEQSQAEFGSSGSASLDDVNEQFHASFNTAERLAEKEAPLIVLFANKLAVRRGSNTDEIEITPDAVHAIKSATHAPVALYALLRGRGGPLSSETRDRLEGLRNLTERARRESPVTSNSSASMTSLLDRTLTFVDELLAVGHVSPSAVDAFATECGKRILPLIEAATALQLEALHSAVEQVLSTFSRAERDSFQVVVAGDHQARVRSLGMQYFLKRLGEKPGDEKRVLYAEGASSVDEAARVCGAQRVNLDLARAFFGDEKRMQRDVLGDATAKLLGSLRF